MAAEGEDAKLGFHGKIAKIERKKESHFSLNA